MVRKGQGTTEDYVAGIEALAKTLAARAQDAACQVTKGREALSAEATTLARARSLVSKASAPMPMREALAKVWRDDPDLYRQYLREGAVRVGARLAPRTR